MSAAPGDVRARRARRNIISNMKTIAVTVDDETLQILNELAAGQRHGRRRSAIVRTALREYAERERRRAIEAREQDVFRRNRKQLDRQARALVRQQARP